MFVVATRARETARAVRAFCPYWRCCCCSFWTTAAAAVALVHRKINLSLKLPDFVRSPYVAPSSFNPGFMPNFVAFTRGFFPELFALSLYFFAPVNQGWISVAATERYAKYPVSSFPRKYLENVDTGNQPRNHTCRAAGICLKFSLQLSLFLPPYRPTCGFWISKMDIFTYLPFFFIFTSSTPFFLFSAISLFPESSFYPE